jgi:plastocyanin
MSADLPGTLRSRALVKLAALLGVVGLSAAACAPASNPPTVPVKDQGGLVVNVVDSLFDAGRSPSVRLGSDGQPVVAYLLYQPVLKEGEIPPAIKPGDPQPPSLVLASFSKGIWSRAAIPPQAPIGKAGGLAPEIANSDGQAIDGVTASLAVDAQGKHHVVWATPKGLFYDTDAGGSFGEAEQVTTSPAYGASVALAGDGTVWISYYGGGNLNVAHGRAGSWTVDRVAANAGPATSPATVTAITLTGSGDPVVAYALQGRTAVSSNAGGSWTSQSVPGEGGYGVSLAIDKDRHVHVAYYARGGGIHQATSTGGGAWDVTDLGSTSAVAGQPDARWGTGIAIDDQGTQSVVWADTSTNQIILASSQGTAEPVQGSQGGANPSIAVSPDGKTTAIAWFDATNTNLDVGVSPVEGLVIAHPLPTNQQPSVSPQPTATGTELPCQPSGTTLQVTAQGTAFDKNCLAAPAGEAFSIDFTNNDAGLPHNVDIYTANPLTAGGTHLAGATDASDTIIGPAQTTYQIDPLDAGIYFFQCDVHPTSMFGTFVVAKAAG